MHLPVYSSHERCVSGELSIHSPGGARFACNCLIYSIAVNSDHANDIDGREAAGQDPIRKHRTTDARECRRDTTVSRTIVILVIRCADEARRPRLACPACVVS